MDVIDTLASNIKNYPLMDGSLVAFTIFMFFIKGTLTKLIQKLFDNEALIHAIIQRIQNTGENTKIDQIMELVTAIRCDQIGIQNDVSMLKERVKALEINARENRCGNSATCSSRVA